MKNIRIGYIGAGANTRFKHLPGFSEIEGVINAAVCNRSFESSQAVAKEFDIDKVVLDWKDIINDSEIDAICIGTWPNMHAELTVAALEAGKHVLCEARMARSLKEAEKMAAAAARENPHLVTQIVPAPFSFSYDKKMKAIFNELPYGELRNAQLVHTVSSAVDVTTPMTWRQDVYLSGKNILSMGIFYETISRWFSEVPEWIIAHGDTFTTMRHSDRSDRLENVQIPDAITIMSGYESGSRIDYHFSGVEYGAGKAEITLNFQEATLIINFNQGSFKLYTQEIPQGEEIEISDEDIMTWQVEADFIDSIRNGTPVSLTSVEKGLEYMRFTELVHQSRRHSGMRVRWNL